MLLINQNKQNKLNGMHYLNGKRIYFLKKEKHKTRECVFYFVVFFEKKLIKNVNVKNKILFSPFEKNFSTYSFRIGS